MKIMRLTLALSLLLFVFATNVQAKETEFEFYYQTIEKVVQINNPKPEGWWETTKSWVKRGYNEIAKTWDMAFGRKYFTGEGSKRWYSREDHCTAYDMKRVKVKSEAHLLQLMGAESEAELSDGQKALLATYRHSLSQAVQERHQYGYLAKVKVILSDTGGYEDTEKYPHVRRDFWPYSQGSLIQMSSKFFDYPGSEADARSTFVHEYAHSMDRTIKEIIYPYGKDGSHYSNELTRPRSAFVEGWAEFNEMLDSEDEVAAMQRSIKKVRVESKTKAGDYKTLSVDDPSLTGTDLLSVEGINAMILYRLANEVPDGRSKIFATFTRTNWKVLRSLSTFVKDFAARHPDDAAVLAGIIDAESKHKLTDAQLVEFAGNSQGMQEYLAHRQALVNPDAAEDVPVAQAPLPSQAAEVNISSHDFNAEIEKIYGEIMRLQKAYVEAVKAGAKKENLELLLKELGQNKARFEMLKKSRLNRNRNK